MFDNKQSCHTSIDIPEDNKMECKFCGAKMVNIYQNWSSFVCINCGGKCVITCKEVSVPSGQCFNYVTKEAIKVTWSKVPVEGIR